jgi:hypothetical protein
LGQKTPACRRQGRRLPAGRQGRPKRPNINLLPIIFLSFLPTSKVADNQKEKINKIIDSVLEEKSEILANLNQESIEVFKFLQSEFHKGDVTKNHLFQFVFRSFYRLDNAGLTPEFKTGYFELMESSRGKQLFEIEIILCELEKFPRIKEQKKGEEKGSF